MWHITCVKAARLPVYFINICSLMMVMPKERDPKEEKREMEEMEETKASEENIEKELTLEEPVATSAWMPKTALGNDVLKGKYESLDHVLRKGELILEPEIIDHLVPDIKHEILYIGGSPGKGGGIRRTATKRTARMHKSGRRFKLTSVIVVGNENGIVGMGKAASKEHRIAIEKATLQAKLNVIRARRGCGSWECGCGGEHSIPFKTSAKHGSVAVTLLPAPKGVGIVADRTSRNILKLAGIKDVWVQMSGNSGARTNLAFAVFSALKNLNRTKGGL